MYSFGLTDAPLASAVELGALQVAEVTVVSGVILVVATVVLVVLGLLDDVISRTSSKTEGGHVNDVTQRTHTHTHTHSFIQSTKNTVNRHSTFNDCGWWMVGDPL